MPPQRSDVAQQWWLEHMWRPNEYQVSSYKHLPYSSFEDAMTWLHQWHQEITRDAEQGERCAVHIGDLRL